MAVWFVAAVVGHDGRVPLVPGPTPRRRPSCAAFPAFADHRELRPGAGAAGGADVVDVPAGQIIRQGEPVVVGQTGLDQSPFLGRWLLLVAAMAAVSALVYGVRRLTRR